MESVCSSFVGRLFVLFVSIGDSHICCFQVCAKYMIASFVLKSIFSAGIS